VARGTLSVLTIPSTAFKSYAKELSLQDPNGRTIPRRHTQIVILFKYVPRVVGVRSDSLYFPREIKKALSIRTLVNPVGVHIADFQNGF
jgi:uncharacterized protein YfaS (alpha-2-macroglobulin family)